MANFLVRGLKPLSGEIEVSGSKNASLAALAASILFKDAPNFLNMPEIEDIKRMKEMLILFEERAEFDTEIAKRFRASILLVGPALAKSGNVFFPHPGGCVIGARPIDAFLTGWEAMGAKVKFEIRNPKSEILNYELIAPNGMHGVDYTFRTQSVTGTEGLMMTAVLAKGETILRNCAMEPEIKYLANFLNKNGADIRGAGSTTICVQGRNGRLLDGREPFYAPPDRIEAGTFMILGALLAKELLIKNILKEEVVALYGALKAAGAEIIFEKNQAVIKKTAQLKAVNIKTKEYPGFPTDLQAPFAVLLTQAKGQSLIHETIFEGRLSYVNDLSRTGANISLMDTRRALISGPTRLHGTVLESPDLRAGLAFVIAALVAEGESKIGNIYQIDRGYARIEERLQKIGADIRRV